jgi:hypothetical protein
LPPGHWSLPRDYIVRFLSRTVTLFREDTTQPREL